MGAYGSPDTGNLYSGNENAKLKKKKNRIHWIILALLYLSIILFADEKLKFIIASMGLFSAGALIVSFIKLVLDLIKKRRVNKDVIIILIFLVVFIVCNLLTSKI